MICGRICTLSLAILGLTAAACRSGATLPRPPIPVRGGDSLRLLLDEPPSHHLQTDPRWAAETIGGSGESIGAVGCTLSSVAMALDRLGIASDPAALNQALKANGGYDERGWLQWRAIAPATGHRARARYYSRFAHATLDAALREGCLPLVKLYLPSGIGHWVLVVGKAKTEYLVRDPLDARRARVALSTLTSQIHALRCVEKHASDG